MGLAKDEDEDQPAPPEDDTGDDAPAEDDPPSDDDAGAVSDDDQDLTKASEDDRQQAVSDYLAKKYGDAADTSDVEDARDHAKRSKMVAGLAQAAEGMARARSEAVGGQGANAAVYNGIRQNADNQVHQAEADRQAKIRDYVTQQAMARQQAQDAQHVSENAARAAELNRWHEDQVEQRRQASKDRADIMKTGLAQKGVAAANRADDKATAADNKADDKATSEQNKNYKEMFNKGEGGRGAPQSVTKAQVAQSSVKNAQELLNGLPKGQDGQPDFNQMSPQQVHLFNGELEKLATNGSPTEGGRAAQDAGTFAQHWAQFKNKFAGPDGEVSGAELGPFIKQSAAYIEGLGKVSDQVVNTYRRSNFDNYANADLISDKHKALYKAQHPELFPEEQKQAAAPAPAPGGQQTPPPAAAHPEAAAALKYAKDHPEDPRSAEILKRLGSANAGL